MSLPLLWGVTLVIFTMTRVLPGDPARVIAGPYASVEEVERLRQEFGLTDPLHVQYVKYLWGLLQGDLGRSLRTEQPVLDEILSRLPNTLLLISLSLGLAALLGVPLGILSSVKRYSWLDFCATSTALTGISIPVFWSGLLLIYLFAVMLHWLPAGGYGTPDHFVLPALTLTLFLIANILRLTRSSILEILTQDYVQTARSKGLWERRVIYKHVLRNAALPIVTIIGVQFGALLGGTILTETVYAWPGIGRLLVDSIFARDYPVLQGTVLIFACIIIATNLVTDLLYAFIDPRIRYT